MNDLPVADQYRQLAIAQVIRRRRWLSLRIPNPRFWLDPRAVLAVIFLRRYEAEIDRRVRELKRGVMETEVSVDTHPTFFGGH